MRKVRNINSGKSRKRKRRRVRGRGNALFGLLFAVAFVCIVTIAVTVFFKVSRVNVVGQTRYSSADVREASGIRNGDNLFIINKFSVIEKISEQFVYLDTVKINRILPDTVEITVTECIPEAALYSQESYWLIGKSGKLLEEVDPARAGDYPVVYGIEVGVAAPGKVIGREDEEERIKPLFEILNSARTNDILNDIVSIDIEKLSDIRLQYLDRFTVEFGIAEDLDRKVRFLKAVIDKLGASDRGVIDLTNSEEVRFRPDYAGG